MVCNFVTGGAQLNFCFVFAYKFVKIFCSCVCCDPPASKPSGGGTIFCEMGPQWWRRLGIGIEVERGSLKNRLGNLIIYQASRSSTDFENILFF